jgi:hypothetical protein
MASNAGRASDDRKRGIGLREACHNDASAKLVVDRGRSGRV